MATSSFLGTAGAEWTDAANWQNRTTPRSGDRVAISASATLPSGELTYGNSTLTNATLTLRPGTDVAFSQLIARNVTISGGTLEGTGLYVYGTVAIDGTLLRNDVVSGSLLAGTLSVAGYLTTLDNFYGMGGIWITRQLTVAARTVLMGRGITLQNAALLFGNPGAGSLTIESDATLTVAPGTGAAPSTIGPGRLVNAGTLAVEAGATLVLAAALSDTGTVSVAAGGTLDLRGAIVATDLPAIVGGGRVLVGGMVDNAGSVLDLSALPASITFADAAGGARIRGGILIGHGTPLRAGTQAAPTVLDAVTIADMLTIAGSAELTGGVAFTGAAAGLTLSGGTLLLDGPIDGASLALDGAVLAATGPTTLAIPVTAAGVTRIDAGVAMAGTLTVAPGGALTLADGVLAASAIVRLGAGAVAVAGHGGAGTIRFDGTRTTLELTGTGDAGVTLGAFQAGDIVRLDALAGASLALTGTVLTVTGTGGTARLRLVDPGDTPYTAQQFQLAPGPGGSAVLSTSHVLDAGADPLFDPAWYLARYGAEVSAAGLDPWQHYLRIGAAEGLDPDAWFDGSFYLHQNPDVAAAGVNPLLHYEQAGWREERLPSLLFSGDRYLAAHPEAAGTDPLLAFVQSGEAATPTAAYQPGGDGSIDPLVWASSVFAQLGATLLPVTGGAAVASHLYHAGAWRTVASPNPLFNGFAYLAANPDVAAAGADPLLHYETFGAGEGRQPDALFDGPWYLAHNPDVAAAGVNPLLHFESAGWTEGRNPDRLFDTGYYLSHNPDVAAARVDPLIHYDQYGWREGRNPSAAFDTNAYLRANPDVAAARVDPLSHYLAYGSGEGRAIYAVG